MKKNLKRMLELAEEFFGAENDPDQIFHEEKDMDALMRIHSSSVTEIANEDGPIAWLVILPTTNELMEKFLKKEISERELLLKTNPGDAYQALYLCAALVLPEFRRQGIIFNAAKNTITTIEKEYSIHALFTWAWSPEGRENARKIAEALKLPLYERPE